MIFFRGELGRVVGAALLATGLLFLVTVLPQGSRETGVPTNIHGIAYPLQGGAYVISQALAHLEAYLREPVAFKKATLSFTYVPFDSQTLAVGIRENEFWLSYAPVVFYEATQTPDTSQRRARISIPLTNKLQEIDRSIDIMFIANGQTDRSLADEVADATFWHLSDVRLETSYDWPSLPLLHDYVRAVITRERAL